MAAGALNGIDIFKGPFQGQGDQFTSQGVSSTRPLVSSCLFAIFWGCFQACRADRVKFALSIPSSRRNRSPGFPEEIFRYIAQGIDIKFAAIWRLEFKCLADLSFDFTSSPANSTAQDSRNACIQIYCKFREKSIIQ